MHNNRAELSQHATFPMTGTSCHKNARRQTSRESFQLMDSEKAMEMERGRPVEPGST